jgi:hypothetical protein
MNTLSRTFCFALLAGALATSAQAQRANVFRNVTQAMETPVSSVTLPVSQTSSLVMPECASCPPKSYPVTANTRFLLGKSDVTVQELRAAVIDKPDLILTVKYSVKTGELVSVTADIEAPRAPVRR